MRILGVSCMFHDASVTMIDDGKIVFAGHAERYSRKKNDAFLHKDLMAEALSYGMPDEIVVHEDSQLKAKRRQRQMQQLNAELFVEPTSEQWLKKFYPQLDGIPVKHTLHHQSHAAAGVLTSNFDDAAIMTIDAIGEVQTATIYRYEHRGGKFELVHEVNFPNSLGLFYSSVTAKVGLKPMEDEYVLMGMAAYGVPQYADLMRRKLFKHPTITDENRGECLHTIDLSTGLPEDFIQLYTAGGMEQQKYDIAASAQLVCEERILDYAELAYKYTHSKNLVFMGGCALNCVANSRLFEIFDEVHIMPNPGDAGSSLGAAAFLHFADTLRKVDWVDPYLGTNIEGTWPVNKFVESLMQGEIFGVANGRAEFGPRALGNRSLFADPRGEEIKDRVNEIKRRQKFRPFAPIILEHHADDWFELPGKQTKSPYMQFVAKCKRPNEIPAVVHGDGTSRVQTVNEKQHPELFEALSKWHKVSGCPIVLNTSLNVKGQPIVNTIEDAEAFTKHYNIRVHTSDN